MSTATSEFFQLGKPVPTCADIDSRSDCCALEQRSDFKYEFIHEYFGLVRDHVQKLSSQRDLNRDSNQQRGDYKWAALISNLCLNQAVNSKLLAAHKETRQAASPCVKHINLSSGLTVKKGKSCQQLTSNTNYCTLTVNHVTVRLLKYCEQRLSFKQL